MKKLVIGIVCLLLMGAVAVWYFMRGGDKARDVLPENTTAVMVFEPLRLFKELDFPLNKVPKLVLNIEDLMEAIDLTKPLYAFASEDGLSGFALNVRDTDKLLKAATSFSFASEEQRGLWWIANKNCIGCFDTDKLLLLAPVPETQQDALRDKMVKLMSQERKDVPVLEKAIEQEGILRACTSLSNLPKQFAKSLPADTDLSKAFLCAALRVEEKAIAYSMKVEGIESLSMPLAPIKGNLAGLEPKKPFIWACVNMKGEELLPLLRKEPQLRTVLLALNMCVDADMMIKAIDGDVVIAIPMVGEHPDFLLTAMLKDTDFLDNANDWSASRRGNTDFIINQDGVSVFFGVRDDKLYIASSEALANKACQKADAEDYQKEVKCKYLSASLDLERLFDTVSKGFSSTALVLNVPQIREAVNALERVSLTADSPQSLELRLETNKPIKEIFSNFFYMLAGDK